MDKPNPTSQVRMSRESHQHAEENIAYIYKNWVQECTSQRGGSIIDLVQNLTQLRWSLERMKIVRPESIRRKRVMSTVYKYIYIYIYTHTHEVRIKKKRKRRRRRRDHALLPDWERRKKNLLPSSRFFIIFFWDLQTYALCEENCELCAAGAALL